MEGKMTKRVKCSLTKRCEKNKERTKEEEWWSNKRGGVVEHQSITMFMRLFSYKAED